MIKKVWMFILAGLTCLTTFFSCRTSVDQENASVRSVVPVTITTPRTGKMTEYTELMATSAFLVKTVIKSPVSGYVQNCSITPGEKVARNQVLFQLRTKESEILQQDSINPNGIIGVVKMKASLDGVVATIEHPQGDFVQEGDILCTLVVPGSLVFLLDVPYEMKNLVHKGGECVLLLPGNTTISSTIRSVLPSMSGPSQTQRVVLQPLSLQDIPENLVARVRIMKNFKNNAVILPKSALLNDEIMKNFWVMKLISDSVAVKVPVEPGMKGTDSIELISPVFSSADRILTSGNYGLGDTALVRIIRHE